MAFGIPDANDLKEAGKGIVDHATAALVPALREAVINALHDALDGATITITVKMPPKETV